MEAIVFIFLELFLQRAGKVFTNSSPCNNQQPTTTLIDDKFENWGISGRVYSRIFCSFELVDIRSHDAFRPIPRRPKIFDRIYYEISFFLLLAKSVAMEPFLPCVQSASPSSSSSSSKSSLSSSSSSSSSLLSSSSSSPSCYFLNLIPFFFSSAFVRRRLINLSPALSIT